MPEYAINASLCLIIYRLFAPLLQCIASILSTLKSTLLRKGSVMVIQVLIFSAGKYLDKNITNIPIPDQFHPPCSSPPLSSSHSLM
ncbi:hypothetical protein ACN38_g1309 [Penicillium nordicum]|uniref:Uncharacterized protein n=1 Tax=Penicillium nordicum TaxID=229535 RepID=A0A0M9WJX6_9EURO|nr:hypothetical protein ACN38_g1309 [Penicillium nordicum]